MMMISLILNKFQDAECAARMMQTLDEFMHIIITFS